MAVIDISTGVAALVSGALGDTAATGVLTDAKAFRFRTRKGVDLDLSGNLVSWNDTVGVRLARHQYLKRRGAEIEPMGAEPGQFTMRLVFLGKTWASNYRALVAAIRDEPRGTMVHPVLGTMSVACTGISEAAVSPGEEVDSVNLTVGFVEDSVDASSPAARFSGPTARKAKVDGLATELTDSLASLGASLALAQTLAAKVRTFAAAAADALEDNAPDTSIDQQLEDAGRDTDELLAKIKSESAARLAGTSKAGRADADAYQAIQTAQRLYAECLALAATVEASRPTVVTYVVPATTSVAAIAATFYGAEGKARVDEVLTLNRVADPHAVPAGTRLRLSAPTN